MHLIVVIKCLRYGSKWLCVIEARDIPYGLQLLVLLSLMRVHNLIVMVQVTVWLYHHLLSHLVAVVVRGFVPLHLRRWRVLLLLATICHDHTLSRAALIHYLLLAWHLLVLLLAAFKVTCFVNCIALLLLHSRAWWYLIAIALKLYLLARRESIAHTCIILLSTFFIRFAPPLILWCILLLVSLLMLLLNKRNLLLKRTRHLLCGLALPLSEWPVVNIGRHGIGDYRLLSLLSGWLLLLLLI